MQEEYAPDIMVSRFPNCLTIEADYAYYRGERASRRVGDHVDNLSTI